MRPLRLLLFFALVAVDLVVLPHAASAAGSVIVSAWTCPEGVVPDDHDDVEAAAAAFAEACSAEVLETTFALTAGDVTRRRVTAEDQPASWPAVSGSFTVTHEIPSPHPAVVFCGREGEPLERFIALEGQIEGDLTADGDLRCVWYLFQAGGSATPVAVASPATVASMIAPDLTPTRTASAPPPPTSTPTSTVTLAPTSTATSTTIPVPTATTAPTATATPAPTNTAVPTATRFPTATPTPTIEATPTERPNPRATATAIVQVIAEATPAYQLALHVLSYARGDQLKVYPDPGDAEDSGFDVQDFVIEVTFINPEPGPDGSWDYGVLFSPAELSDDYGVFVNSDGTWFAQFGSNTLRQEEFPDLRLGEGEDNRLRLIVLDGRGTLFVNERYAGSFELRNWHGAGTLWLATTNIDGQDQAFLDLSIWSLR